MLRSKVLEKWFVLVAVQVDIAVSQCLVGGNVIGKLHHCDFESLIGRFFGHCFGYLGMRTRSGTKFDFLLCLLAAAAEEQRHSRECTQGKK